MLLMQHGYGVGILVPIRAAGTSVYAPLGLMQRGIRVEARDSMSTFHTSRRSAAVVLLRLAFLLWSAFMGLIFGGFVGLVVGFALDVVLEHDSWSLALSGAYLGAGVGMLLGIIAMGAKVVRDR